MLLEEVSLSQLLMVPLYLLSCGKLSRERFWRFWHLTCSIFIILTTVKVASGVEAKEVCSDPFRVLRKPKPLDMIQRAILATALRNSGVSLDLPLSTTRRTLQLKLSNT